MTRGRINGAVWAQKNNKKKRNVRDYSKNAHARAGADPEKNLTAAQNQNLKTDDVIFS